MSRSASTTRSTRLLAGYVLITLLTAFLTPSPVVAGPVHEAAKAGDTERLKAILDKNPEAWKMKNKSKNLPLHVAARAGQDAAVALLLDRGADIEALGFLKWTALHCAARSGDAKTCQLLLERGADRDALDGVDRTALQTARGAEAREVLKNFRVLLPGAERFIKAASEGKLDEVREWLEKSPELIDAVDASGATATLGATFQNHPAVLELLLERGADPNVVLPAGRVSALYLAASLGHVDAVKLLLKHKAEVNPTFPAKADPFLANSPLSAATNTRVANPSAQRLRAAMLKSEGRLTFEDVFRAEVGDQSHGEYFRSLWKLDPEPLRASKREIVVLLLEAKADPDGKGGNKPLGEAALSGETEMVRLLLEAGADPNRPGNGSTPLAAAAMGDPPAELIQLLLDAGADPLRNGAKLAPMSAIEMAGAVGNVEAFGLMLAKLNPKKLSKLGRFTVVASATGHPDSLKKALDAGFDVNVTNGRRVTPLHRAANSNSPESLRLLLDAGAKVGAKDSEGFTPLHNAAEYGQAENIALLLKRGAALETTTRDGRTPLICACGGGGDAESVALLVEAGAKLESRSTAGLTALMTAAGWGRPKIVARLIEAGANVNATTGKDKPLGADTTVLSKTAQGVANADGDTQQDGGRVDGVGTEADYLRIAELLIENGAKIDASGKANWSLRPLEIALRSGSEKMVRLLLKNGAKPDAPSKLQRGRTPIWSAIVAGDQDMLELMIAEGVNINAPDGHKVTPLHWAVEWKQPQMVETLLKHGAKINAQSNQGATPLFHAVATNSPESLRVLLKAGANKSIKARVNNALTMTPLEYARASNNAEMTRLLSR